MVVMAASLAVVVVLAFSMVGAKRPCDGVDPAIRNFTHDFTNGNCLYIRQEEMKDIENWKDWEGAKNVCESLGQYPHKWRLVELKSESLHNVLDQVIMRIWAPNVEEDGWYSFWMGLVREEVKDSSDVFNRSAWANPSKWRWTSDNSTLLSWSNGSQVPWDLGFDEPNSWQDIHSRPELCVLVHRRSYVRASPASSVYWQWFDKPCSAPVQSLSLPNPYIICESMDVSTTTTSTPTTTAPTSPTDPETNSSYSSLPTTPAESESSPWMWVGISVAIAIVLAVVACLAYRAIQQRRKRQPFMLSADSDQSGTYENMPRYKGKRRPMRKDDESESESLDTSRGSRKKRLGPKKPKLSWMIDRKDEPKSPLPVQPEGKAAVPKKPEGKAAMSKQPEGKAAAPKHLEGKAEVTKQLEGKAKPKSLEARVMKKY